MGAQERIIKLAILLIFVSVLAYSGLWFYRADVTKRSLSNELLKVKDFNLGSFSYGAIDVKGFPLAFTIEISNLQLKVRDKAPPPEGMEGYTQYHLPKLLIVSNFSGDTYSIQPIGNIHIITTDRSHAEVTLINSRAVAQFQGKSWRDTLSNHLNPGKLLSFHYQDEGFNIIATKDGEKILSGTGNSIKLKRTPGQKGDLLNLSVKSALERGNSFNWFTGKNLTSKNLSVDINTSSQLSKGNINDDIEFNITKAFLKLDSIDFYIEGKVKGPALMLYSSNSLVDLKFSTTDYNLLLEAMVNNGWTDEANKTAIVKLLPDIADVMDKKNLTIVLRHTQGERDFYLGKLTLAEAESKFNTYLQSEVKPLQASPSEGNTTIPSDNNGNTTQQ